MCINENRQYFYAKISTTQDKRNMGHYACIAIGINHYQFLEPLSYGQADAFSLRQFLVNQANLPSNQFLLLSDTSPLIDDVSTYPTQENIWRHLEAEQASWHSANYRWFFFSGYGVSWEGVDYLMPIDGNPNDIPRTAIPMRTLLATLKDAGGENLLVLLDINRSPGLPTGLAVGEETIAIAQEMNITLIFSSQLDQFSHEAVALGNGLFTAALLEALRYYQTDTTLANLEQYLRSYLPQLSQHHYRPIQNPLMIVPVEEARQQLILPTVATPVTIPADVLHLTGLNVSGDYDNTNNGASIPRQPAPEIPADKHLNLPTPAPPPPRSNPNFQDLTPYQHQKNGIFDSLGLQFILLGGGAVLVLLLTLAAILLNNRKILIGNQAATIVPDNAIATTTSALPSSERLSINRADLEQARRLLRPNQASLFNQAITQARKVQPGDPLYPQAQQDMARWSRVILDLAQGRAASQKFAEAIATAKLVPDDDPVTYKTTQEAIANWQIMAQQYSKNQAVIQEAKVQLQPNQASSYRRGINILSKIPPNQPGYNQAQKLIEQWSRTIYLIAQSRASQGKLESAIETVTLVPSGTSSFEAAQKAQLKWKQGKR
ncbi:MAG: caspase family protein [Coleofasciculaceae cyanobacterium]